MKIYAQFLRLNNGKYSLILGSSGVFVLDARKTIESQKLDCIDRIEKLNNIHPDIVGFEIVWGSNFNNNNTIIFSSVKDESKTFRQLWEEFEDIPINYEDDQDGEIDQDWHIFEKGTNLYSIWHWFENKFDVCIGDIINGVQSA